MSIEAMVWVKKHAPSNNTTEMCILYALADHANDDGTGCWPYYENLADAARCSVPTVKRHIKELERRGVIKRGNQSLVNNYPAYRRPIVWDLNMNMRRDVEKAGYQDDTSLNRGINGDGAGYQPEQSEVSTATNRGITVDTDNLPTTVKEPSSKPQAPTPQKQGHRLPEDWAPKPATITRLTERFPNADLAGSAEDFKAHWLNATGKGAAKLNWDMAFGTWVKNDKQWGKNQKTASTSKPRQERLAAWGAPSTQGHTTTSMPRTLAERAGLTDAAPKGIEQ